MARDFATDERVKNEGILDVFLVFNTARMRQKIRHSAAGDLFRASLTLDDSSEIVHSEMRPDHTVMDIEKPDEHDCFHHAACILPGYQWEDISGFTEGKIARYEEVIRSTAHLILRFAQEGGFDSASDI